MERKLNKNLKGDINVKIDEKTRRFDPLEYYSSYPSRVILRPGYPARAQYKSTLLWNLYGHIIMKSLGSIDTYADIGGCFGFGANAMAFHISKCQGNYPETKVFEISSDFITSGKQLFPYIGYIQDDFCLWNGTPKVFDLVTMFDVIEHIPNPISFLSVVANHSKFALIKTPLETGGDWFGGKPPVKQGNEHTDGHINFFTPRTHRELLEKSGFDIVSAQCVFSIVPSAAEDILNPEDINPGDSSELVILKMIKRVGRILVDKKIIPYYFMRKIYGHGDHLCLVKSANFG